MFFIDQNNGIAVGTNPFEPIYKGAVLRTSDGGLTWIPQNMGVTNELLDVTFTNLNNGIIVGMNGTILITTNGGATWTIQLTSITDGLTGVTFTDSSNGVIVGYDTILKTADGGKTWIPQEVITSNFLYSVSFTDVDNGWIVGTNGTILHTTNGGVTFIEDEKIILLNQKNFYYNKTIQTHLIQAPVFSMQ